MPRPDYIPPASSPIVGERGYSASPEATATDGTAGREALTSELDAT
jgi:hypothetical protein